jgi:hypothetical protein
MHGHINFPDLAGPQRPGCFLPLFVSAHLSKVIHSSFVQATHSHTADLEHSVRTLSFLIQELLIPLSLL